MLDRLQLARLTRAAAWARLLELPENQALLHCLAEIDSSWATPLEAGRGSVLGSAYACA